MNIGVIGVNHNSAPISIRERVSFTDTKKIESINYLLDYGIKEIIIISTCNRSEIYICSKNIEDKVEIVKDFYEEFFEADGIKEYLFSKTSIDAIQHLYDVAAGLDSIVLGEDQILGQVKDAQEFSMKLGASGKILNKLFRESITTAKEIKNETKISQNPLSISYIGVKFLKERLGSLKDKNVLIIGVGKMSRLTLNHLREEEVKDIYVCNRSYCKVEDIKDEYENIIPIKYEDRYKTLDKVDIVISATSSPHTVIKYNDMPTLSNEIYMMDIALPRDIDDRINEIKNVKVFDIDDLKKISDENDKKRKELAKKAKLFINESIDEYVEWLESIKIDPTIESLNERCHQIQSDTIDYIFRKVELSNKEKKIVDKMLSSALKRLVREPILTLKQIRDEGQREEYIKVVEDLFDL